MNPIRRIKRAHIYGKEAAKNNDPAESFGPEAIVLYNEESSIVSYVKGFVSGLV